MSKNKLQIKDEQTEFLLYTTPNGKVKVEIFFHNENIWLSQKRMAELFGVQRPAITKHLGNIFKERELDEISVSSILEHTTQHGAITGKGTISAKQAEQKAFSEYKEFNKTQKILSDFDKQINRLKDNNK